MNTKPYTAKSLAGAQTEVRRLRRKNAELIETLDQMVAQRNQLAKLAATGPAFFNPLEIIEAKRIRDFILYNLNMNPDRTFIQSDM